ncbi:hypothetical protein P0Y43_18435 [Pseudomonas entomophila]|uniref:hypothetical protein n=1 Tax=Pseudomonas entomophila TaxID=312306 RepID=UPI0023D867C0|nr:hypothetical protein [Pseudomonas entomophila]MDF0732669.1 hypothetical protein [Pseudomonas entomophila]
MTMFFNRMIERLWPNEPWWRKSYRIATYLSFCMLVHVLATKNFLAGHPYTLPIGAFASAGFCVWLWPKIRDAWLHKLTQPFKGLIHAGIALASYLLARIVVGEILQLPAKDFEGTVALVAIYLCPCIYLLLMAIACVGTASVALVTAGTLVILNSTPLRMASGLIGGRLLGIAFFTRDLPEQSKTVNTLLAHVLGAMATGVAIATCHDLAQAALLKNPQLVKRIAYHLDYQHARNYPGIRQGPRVVLHDNGVVSYATLSQGRVEIKVDMVAVPTAPSA